MEEPSSNYLLGRKKKPALDYLRVFECLCYAITVGQWDKMGPRARRFIFMGYPNIQKKYRVLEPSTGEFSISRDVIFHEVSSHFMKKIPQMKAWASRTILTISCLRKICLLNMF